MPTQVQFRRGTTTQNESFTGAVGELSVDTTLDTIRVHDGSTAGGIRLAKYSEIQSGDITAVVAGTGLSGGATSGSATVNLSHLGLESLSDPNDDQIIFWDDSAGATAFLDLGTGLSISGTTISVGTLNQDTTGNAATATALETARTIHGVSFDGTANIDLSEVVQDTVGAMFSSNTETGITVSYEDGDGTIDLVVGTLNQDTTGNAATATALATARTINGVSFDGTANVTTLTAGTGVSVSGTAVSIGQAVATSSNVTFADVAATGNLTVTGNLDVNGTTTTLDTTNSTIADRLIELGNGTTGTPGNDMGLVLERGSSDNVLIGWDESTDNVVVGTGSFTGASTGDLTYTAANFTAGIGTFSSLDISGDADIDGTMEADAYTVDGTALAEYISDTVGAMVSSNTESGITVAYDDSDNTLDFTVGTLNQNTTGSAATLTTARAIAIAGDVVGTANFDGSADISITATIQANSVALGTDTTGNYMAQVSGGDGITISHTQGEGSTATITGTAIYNASGTKLN